VGSIAIQLARRVARLAVVATASRPESADWARARGADHIIDHGRDLGPQLRDIGLAEVDYVFCANATARHFPTLAACMNPSAKKFPSLLRPLVTDDADSTMKIPNSERSAVTEISIVTFGESASNRFRNFTRLDRRLFISQTNVCTNGFMKLPPAVGIVNELIHRCGGGR
jgi:threonine dehydrogenase-like Zn-dependent dehydrogenase